MKRQPTALITGANRGLGLQTARQLGARGWKVVLACRDATRGAEAAREVPGAQARLLDVGKTVTAVELAAALAADGITLDVLINNAAVSRRGFDARVAASTLAVNLFGTLAVTAALAPRLADGGAIVMVSSGMGELSSLRDPARGHVARARTVREVEARAALFIQAVAAARHAAEGWPANAYVVSKALLNAATRALALELAPRHLRVNAVCPGWVRTDLGGPSATRDVRTGAASIVAAVLEPSATGGFFRDGKPIAW